MPIRIRYQNDSSQECTIRPTPLVSINTNILKNGAGEAFGVTYTITLTGTLLPDEGSPYALDHVADGQAGRTSVKDGPYPFWAGTSPVPAHIGPYGAFDSNRSHTGINKPPRQQVPQENLASAILSKQRSLKALFAQDGQRLEITDVREDIPAVICYPRVVSINFSEGTYTNKSDFTINLEADVLLHQEAAGIRPDLDGTLIPIGSGDSDRKHPREVQLVSNEDLVVALSGAFIKSFSESWAVQVDDGGSSAEVNLGDGTVAPRGYRISHTINAAGKTHYMHKDPEGTAPTKIPAWESAKKFVTNRLFSDGAKGYPNVFGKIGSGTLNLVDKYGGFNLVRTENVSESAGTFSVTENWFLSSGVAYENFNLKVSSSNNSPFVQVSVDGTIKGLSTFSPSGTFHGGLDGSSIINPLQSGVNAYDNALSKYNEITNSGFFGVGSHVYKRANNMVAVGLNSQPASVSIGANKFTGNLTYSLAFDNRPTNIISGAITESIQVNDTYPGDVFAVIPVLGRKTGPVLQYIGGRTEHKRDVSINLVMDYTKIPYGSGRDPIMLKKPSVVEPTATQLAKLLKEVSPQQEPGIRKCFISPPSESWNPKAGTYSFNVSFTYELDR